METGCQVQLPRPPAAGDETVAPEQKTRTLRPGARPPPAAVVPQVGQRLAHQVDGKGAQGHLEDVVPPLLVAAQRQVQVESRAAVFAFFAAVPQPHVAQPGFSALQHVGMGQHVFGKDGGEVFGRGRDSQPVAHVQRLQQRPPRQDAFLPGVDQALTQQVFIETLVDAAVRGLLADEALHFGVEAGTLRFRQCGHRLAHRIDEELFTGREAHRQRIEKRAAKGVAAPVARQRGVQIDEQAAHRQGDGEGVHGGKVSPRPPEHAVWCTIKS